MPTSTVPGITLPPAGWAARDASILASRTAEFERAIEFIGSRREQGEIWTPLPEDLESLSRYGAVYARFTGAPDESALDYVYFDTGESDYPVVDGLYYSDSEAPPAAWTLGTAYQVAPHWWVAQWDPLMIDGLPSAAGKVPMIGEYPDGDAIDREFVETDARRIEGPERSIEGTVVTWLSSQSYDCEWVWVDIGQDKPVCIALNKWTDWSTASAELLTWDHPTLRLSARVRTKWLTVNGRRQTFAVSAKVMEP